MYAEQRYMHTADRLSSYHTRCADPQAGGVHTSGTPHAHRTNTNKAWQVQTLDPGESMHACCCGEHLTCGWGVPAPLEGLPEGQSHSMGQGGQPWEGPPLTAHQNHQRVVASRQLGAHTCSHGVCCCCCCLSAAASAATRGGSCSSGTAPVAGQRCSRCVQQTSAFERGPRYGASPSRFCSCGERTCETVVGTLCMHGGRYTV